MTSKGESTSRAWTGMALASVLAWLGLAGRQNSLTAGTCEARMAKAVEAPTWVLQAIPSVCCMTDTWATLIDVCLTAQTGVSWRAAAAEATYQIHAGTIVQAPRTRVQGWLWATVILINFTEHTLCPRGAGTKISSHEVNAEASVLAGLGGTLIHIIFTVITSVTNWTLTHVAPHVASAGTPMLAGLGQAGVHFLLTVAACPALWTHTIVGAVLIHTLPTSLTQLFLLHTYLGCCFPAGQTLDVTQAATPPGETKAVERGPCRGTATSILAGRTATPVYQRLAIGTSEALWAGAAEARVSGCADAPMHTGL